MSNHQKGPIQRSMSKIEAMDSASDDGGVFTPAEYKGMETKGIKGAGKITLDQYERLVKRGYDGDVVKRWTQHHASQVLRGG